MIDGNTIQKCEVSKDKFMKSGLKCNYLEFGENLTTKSDREIDTKIADFWNEIDQTMVKKRKPQSIQVTQTFKAGPSYQNFE